MNEIEKLVSENPGMQFIPIAENKRPIPEKWQKVKTKYDFTNQVAVGLVCGEISGGLEAIDIDCKYDLTGTLYDDYKKSIHEKDSQLLSLLIIQKTMNNGYHMIYRCDEISGNKAIARRPAIAQEIEKGERTKVLIETRGEGGYVACTPTKGYRFVYGELSGINKITPEQRQILFESAYEFNEVISDYVPPKQTANNDYKTGLSPFEAYDNCSAVLDLLQRHGWKITKERGNKIHFLRPGTSTADSSGNFDTSLNRFSVFSTSTEFESGRGYKPYAVYAYLECNKNFNEASKKLYNEGYGDRTAVKQENRENTPSGAKGAKNDSPSSNINIVRLEFVKHTMQNTFIHGKVRGETTHFANVDPHFTWKKDSLICATGYPGHGKTELMLNLLLVKAVRSSWRWAIYCPENMPADELYDSLVHSYIGKTTDNKFPGCMNQDEYEKGMKFINEHFVLVDPETPTLDSVLENFKYLIDSERIDGCLIDPWNQLLHNFDGREDLYLSNQLLKAKKFCRDENVVTIISAHPTKPTIDKGELPTPNEYSLSGGAMWNNKCDIILVVHRPSYHTNRASTDVELHSRKIKKQKLVGVPGVIYLTFNRATNRYYHNGTTPLDTIERRQAAYIKSMTQF